MFPLRKPIVKSGRTFEVGDHFSGETKADKLLNAVVGGLIKDRGRNDCSVQWRVQ